jgi:hypothetical protein
MSIRIVAPHAVYLREGIRREPPRPPQLRQPTYEATFDFYTCFYDVLISDNTIRLIGPPMGSLLNTLDTASFALNNKPIPSFCIHLRDADRTQMSYIDISGMDVQPGSPYELIFSLAGTEYKALATWTSAAQLKGRRALITKSRNNDPRWIADWITYYKLIHEVDVVILYDNQSDAYSISELRDSLAKASEGIDVVIVQWDFPFGPQGGVWAGHKSTPWDSDYCEYGILEHAKHCFLKHANLVIHHDIDELLLPVEGGSIERLMIKDNVPYARYSGAWVSSAFTLPTRTFSFCDYTFLEQTSKSTTTKWVLRPALVDNEELQWKTHGLRSLPQALNKAIEHRHFRAISTNWKFDRSSNNRPQFVTQCPALASVFCSLAWIKQPDLVRHNELILRSAKDYFQPDTHCTPHSVVWNDQSSLVFKFKTGSYLFAIDVHLRSDNSLGIIGRGSNRRSRLALENMRVAGTRIGVGRYLFGTCERNYDTGLFGVVKHHAERLHELFLSYESALQAQQ